MALQGWFGRTMYTLLICALDTAGVMRKMSSQMTSLHTGEVGGFGTVYLFSAGTHRSIRTLLRISIMCLNAAQT